MKSKILLMLVCTFGLVACQNIQIEKSASPDVTLKFKLPPNNQAPERAPGTKKITDVKVGGNVGFELEAEPGTPPTLLLVVMGRVADETSHEIIEVATPFENEFYTLRLTRGNNNKVLKITGKEGIYKYSLIDITGGGNNTRPPRDPMIRVGPGNQ